MELEHFLQFQEFHELKSNLSILIDHLLLNLDSQKCFN